MRAGWIGSDVLASRAPSRSRAARSAARSPSAHSGAADVPVGASRSDSPRSTRGRSPRTATSTVSGRRWSEESVRWITLAGDAGLPKMP